MSNLGLRIIAILLSGFVIIQLLLLAVTALPTRGDAHRPFNLPQPDDVRVLAETLETSPPARRAELLSLFNDSLYTLRLARGSPAGFDGGLSALHATYAAALPGRTVTLPSRRPLIGGAFRENRWTGRLFSPVQLTVRLSIGETLVIESRPSAVVRTYLRRRALLGVIGGLLLLAILTVAVRRATKPLVRLSAGVRRFGSELDAPDVPVEGAREMRELAVAYNDMKRRIADLVNERTRILAAVAHDMRTYITRLRLRTDFIEDPEQRRKAAADLQEMSAMLDDTLLFARQDASDGPDPAHLDIDAEIEALVAVRREMEDAVWFDGGAKGTAVRLSPLALRRILANLIDNGLRHGTTVSLSTTREGETIEIRVSDNGPGVPAAALARLGEPFGRLDPSRDRTTGGVGLGLAIVRALVERSDGTVRFANQDGGGLLVCLSFPAAPPARG
ncbi:ATP-binding protein [Sphingosinicella soli]|uniref:histidine kinase n=1 Tax=Sphingosinicella soli TaxID=333708 RepID=A0A7W7B0Y3_9SPHN|nr:ATP-binding protein [Sphingosinicella soli]MBB4630960.1 signal transduction histidine kinase [Sphingosinicella soli]